MYSQLLSLLALAPAVSYAAAIPCGDNSSDAKPKAIYLSTNEADNGIVSLPIYPNGMIGLPTSGVHTATGGKGTNGISAMTKMPAFPDALFSQSSVTVVGNYLFAVNAGSNSLSMFTINENDPTKLTAVHEPLSLPGDFPNTVAASWESKVVCVGFTGVKSGISCSTFSEAGLGPMDQLRDFGLKQSNPPVGAPNTLSQVFFSNDQKTLYSTVKGDPATNKTGFFASYPVYPGSVGQQGTKSAPKGTAVLFGAATIPNSDNVIVADPSFGAAILNVNNKNHTASTVAISKINGQSAICWAAVNPTTNTAFVTDGAINRLVEVSLADASVVSVVDLSSNGDPGLFDLATAGKYVYALSPGNGTTEAAVTVVDVQSKKQVQHVQLGSLGARMNSEGLTLFY